MEKLGLSAGPHMVDATLCSLSDIMGLFCSGGKDHWNVQVQLPNSGLSIGLNAMDRTGISVIVHAQLRMERRKPAAGSHPG